VSGGSSPPRSAPRRRRALLLASVVLVSTGLFSADPEFFFRGNPFAGFGALQGSGAIQGVPAPDFCITDIDGAGFCLSEFRGRPVVIDFMATWCVACEDQAVELREVHQRYGDKVVFLSIDVDLAESPAELRGFREYVRAPWRFVTDTPTTRVGLKYETRYLPSLYVVDKEGFIAWHEKGITDSASLIQLLRGMV